MRGKHLRTEFPREADGITPADAGKTCYPKTTKIAKQDHPRGCGENQYGEQECDWDMGSPPRMRGKRQPAASGQGRRGITPADAGKTLARAKGMVLDKGSPPRMRGKPRDSPPPVFIMRITPADAGKTIYMPYPTRAG